MSKKEIKEGFDAFCKRIGININSDKIQLNEIGLNRFIGKHVADGYVIISACRGDLDILVNKQRTAELKNDIKAEGYSFIPVSGGFIENQGTEMEREVLEDSFIIPITKRNGNRNQTQLFELGKGLTNKYNQDSFLFSYDNQTAYYDKNGNKDFEFSGKMALNDVLKTYFTKLKGNAKTNQVDRRFTFEGKIYVNGKSTCYNTNHIRYMDNEIQLWL